MNQLTGNATIVDNFLKETSTHGTKKFPFIVYLNDFANFQNVIFAFTGMMKYKSPSSMRAILPVRLETKKLL